MWSLCWSLNGFCTSRYSKWSWSGVFSFLLQVSLFVQFKRIIVALRRLRHLRRAGVALFVLAVESLSVEGEERGQEGGIIFLRYFPCPPSPLFIGGLLQCVMQIFRPPPPKSTEVGGAQEHNICPIGGTHPLIWIPGDHGRTWCHHEWASEGGAGLTDTRGSGVRGNTGGFQDQPGVIASWLGWPVTETRAQASPHGRNAKHMGGSGWGLSSRAQV